KKKSQQGAKKALQALQHYNTRKFNKLHCNGQFCGVLQRALQALQIRRNKKNTAFYSGIDRHHRLFSIRGNKAVAPGHQSE
ncbi:TPA: hypothetical protein ACGS3T_004315, partial [Escherichia coli]